MCSLIQTCTLLYTILLSYVGHQNRLYNTLPIRMNVLFTLRHYACVFTKSQKNIPKQFNNDDITLNYFKMFFHILNNLYLCDFKKLISRKL